MAITLADSTLFAGSAVLTALDFPLSTDEAAGSATLELGSASGTGTASKVAFEHHARAQMRRHAVTHGGNRVCCGTRSAVRVAVGATAGS